MYEFGPFRLDVAERQLLRDGQPVPLTPKAFDLLVYFVEHPNKLLDKDTLFSALWPDTVVEEANLAFQVSALRRMLDEGRRGPSLIQTVPTRGYRFVAKVQSTPVVADSFQDKGRRRGWNAGLLAGGMAAGVLLGLVLGWRWLTAPQPSSLRAADSSPFVVTSVTTLTGVEDEPGLSPTGDQVVFSWAPANRGHRNLYVTLTGTSSDVRQLTTADADDSSASFSPDGRSVAFIREYGGGRTRIHVTSALGGSDTKVSEFSPAGGLSWTRDGRAVLVGRNQPDVSDRGIYLVPVDGGEARALTATRAPAGDIYPILSPDAGRLAFVSCKSPFWFHCAINVAAVGPSLDQPLQPETIVSMPIIRSLAWSTDNRTLYFAGDANGSQNLRLWAVDVNRPTTLARLEIAGQYIGPRVSMAAGRLLFSRDKDDVDVFRLDRGGRAVPIISSSSADVQPDFSPDAESITFVSDRSGSNELWVANADGTNPRQLTHGPHRHQASARGSPDGAVIAFDSQSPDGHWHIWTIDAEGGQARQLTTMAGNQSVPFWSRDGQWVYYIVDMGQGVARVPRSGGRPEVVLTRPVGMVASESADGAALVFQDRNEDSAILMRPLSGGEPVIAVPCARVSEFDVVSRGIYYVPCGAARDPAVMVRDVGRGSDQLFGTLTSFVGGKGSPRDLGVSRDGNSVVYGGSVSRRGDLWMIERLP